MPTFNKGIRTNAGKLLAKRVEAGQTHITYTRIVFSSRDLSGSSDDDIAGMTALWPQEIAVTPDTIDLNAQDPNRPDTEVRAITSNDDLNQGLTVRSYGLYAMDDDKREVLFGVAVDDEPSYLPAHQPGAQSQYLTYDWETAISDTDKVVFTNNKNVYVAYNEFDDYKKSAQSQLDSTAGSVVASASSFTSGQTAYGISTANSYTNARAGGLQYQMSNSDASLQNQINQASANATGSAASAINQADSNMTWNRDSINASMNALPHWNDIDYTRNVVAPSAANSAKNAANDYTNDARDYAVSVANSESGNLQGQINNNNAGIWSYANSTVNSLSSTAQSNLNHVSFVDDLPDKDLDNDQTTGNYTFNTGDLVHAPDGSMYGWVIVINSNAAPTITQFYSNLADIWMRYKTGSPSVWGSWNRITTEKDFNNLQNQIWGNRNDLNGIISDKANGLQDQITNNNNDLNNKLSDNTNNLQNQIISNNTNIVNNLSNNTKDLQTQLDHNNRVTVDVHPGDYFNADYINTTCVAGIHNAGTDYGLPLTTWGDLYTFVPANEAGYGYQIYYTVDNNIWYRGANISFNKGNFKGISWRHIANDLDVSNLQNQINNHPNWNDENYTRSVVATSIASDAKADAANQANNAATNAMNQANAYTNGKTQDTLNQANANMEANRSGLQTQLDHNNKVTVNIQGSSYFNADYINTTCVAGIHNVGADHGLPYEGFWGDLYTFVPDNEAGYGYQVLFNVGGDLYFRGTNLSFNHDNFTGVKWRKVGYIDTAANEDDARDKSNNNPGQLYIYPD